MRWPWLGVVLLLVATSSSTVSTGANQVAPSLAASVTRTVDADALKPAECAALELTLVVVSGTGSEANELILGTGSGETGLGGGGDDCIVAGAGDDVLVGGAGGDVCIGGAGRDSYDASCEVRLEDPPGVPDPPTGIDAVTTSSTSITLSWTDTVEGEDGFAIERSPAGSGSWAEIATTGPDVVTLTDTGLSAGAAYDYRVRAFNAAAYSLYSDVASASTLSCAAPGTTTVYADRDVFVVQEYPTTNPHAYVPGSLVVRSGAGRNARTLLGFPLPVIPEGCAITAAILRLESTTEVLGRTLEALQASGPWTETGVTWDDQPATTGAAAMTSSALGWVSWSVTEHVAAMYAGTDHGFVVRDSVEGAAIDQTQVFASREGGNAPELVVTFGEPPPPPAPPSAPTGLSATAVSGSRIDLSWTDTATDEDGFTVERSPAGIGTWAQIATTDADVTVYADTGLTTDTAYDYRVRAVNTGGTSAWSGTASATTGSCASPGTTVETDRDTLVYEGLPTANAGSETYVAVQSASGANARALVGFPLPVLPEGCSLTGATLRLNASLAAGGRTLTVQRAATAWTEAGVTWSTQPATTGSAASTTSGLGWVDWDVRAQVVAMYAGADHGFVIRDAAEGAATDQTQVFASREGDPTLAAELTLTYGEVPEPPSSPSGLTATAVSASRIELSWTDDATDEDGFTVERSPAGLDTWTEIATTDADVTNHADTGLAPDTAYDYRVRAFNSGGTSTWSGTASATTTSCATPGTTTVYADRDVLVAQEAPTTNFQTPTYQEVLAVQSRDGNRNARALVGFALPAIPPGCTVTDATLRLNAGTAMAGRTLLAYQADATWTETGVTWNTQPGTTGTAATATSGTGWRDWAVAAQVTAMYGGANHGFVIRDAAEGAAAQQTQVFASREGADPPQLVISFG